MNYYEYKLDGDDFNQYQQLLQMVQQLRNQVNKETDEIEKLINLKIQEGLKLREAYKLEEYQQIYFNNDIITFENQFNNLASHSLKNILSTKNNKLEYIKPDMFKILQISPVIMKLKEIIQQFNLNINVIKPMIMGQNAVVVQNNYTVQQIWKHQTIAKSGDKFKTFTFKKNQGFAEPFLCKSSFELNGILHAQLFTGVNADGKQLNCQKDIHRLQFSIHEGLDLSSYYYTQEIYLDHQKLKQMEQPYEIMLYKSILLKKGVTYTISLKPLSDEGFSTYMYTGKQGENQQFLKFLDKQIDLIDQIVIAQQQFNQSPIPGFIING
ncbi:unnamed protein product (macronuclear) [Paramecium tetraurelia]|uniref:PHR domain-containing protein n=1 Tax=Paramecium tetraurelia TaxID=5888 RepID=A0E094_PARTE|nr:uncharacterized protein GSPATT00021879001 [Paramecium tetraurelia]CAK88711.1 unnamed protein product [Paramecium tetraurelia]|eukprot:XP_001456108.1 hypothetical protein (macronuclear) [Paramecium tetraurelia strain d4-2]